ncbi:MAG: hypothetical protein LBF40_06560 [Deltaproteobacteria bacterium]|nr:hypothetical protein [Deltaproteobacteria bacterium]
MNPQDMDALEIIAVRYWIVLQNKGTWVIRGIMGIRVTRVTRGEPSLRGKKYFCGFDAGII